MYKPMKRDFYRTRNYFDAISEMLFRIEERILDTDSEDEMTELHRDEYLLECVMNAVRASDWMKSKVE